MACRFIVYGIDYAQPHVFSDPLAVGRECQKPEVPFRFPKRVGRTRQIVGANQIASESFLALKKVVPSVAFWTIVFVLPIVVALILHKFSKGTNSFILICANGGLVHGLFATQSLLIASFGLLGSGRIVPRLLATCAGLAVWSFLMIRMDRFLNPKGIEGVWLVQFSLIPFLILPHTVCRIRFGWTIATKGAKFLGPQITVAWLLASMFCTAAYLGPLFSAGVKEYLVPFLQGVLAYVPIATAAGVVNALLLFEVLRFGESKRQSIRWIGIASFATLCIGLTYFYYCVEASLTGESMVNSIKRNSFFVSFPVGFLGSSSFGTLIAVCALRRMNYRLMDSTMSPRYVTTNVAPY